MHRHANLLITKPKGWADRQQKSPGAGALNGGRYRD
jgi:hypothetical protein